MLKVEVSWKQKVCFPKTGEVFGRLANQSKSFQSYVALVYLCIFESFLYSPGRTTDNIGCAVVRLAGSVRLETEDLIVTDR